MGLALSKSAAATASTALSALCTSAVESFKLFNLPLEVGTSTLLASNLSLKFRVDPALNHDVQAPWQGSRLKMAGSGGT